MIEDSFDFDLTDMIIENRESGIKIPLESGAYLTKRNVPKVIRYVQFSSEKHPELFFREQLMLFISRRNENDIMGQSYSYACQYQVK